jgi:flagellar biosynthesis protein FliQ
MSQEFIVHLFREAFVTMLTISGPILAVSLFVGLIISIIQAATSVQEFTITFVPKIIVVAVVTVILLPWMIDVMVAFTRELFQHIPELVH